MGSSSLTERNAPWENLTLGKDTFLSSSEIRKGGRQGDCPKHRAGKAGTWAGLVPVLAKRLTSAAGGQRGAAQHSF